MWDDENEVFLTTEDVVLELEHSLVSLSKWEALWEKPFLSNGEKTTAETYSYIMCMTLTPNVPPEVFSRLSSENLDAVNKYIEAKMTATTFANTPKKPAGGTVITAEIIYYWMVTLNVPIHCENWHLARLFSFIKVCNEKNSPKKKMSRNEIAQRNRDLNAQRKAEMGTRG